ncbi:MAG TPA: alpha/beta hydrolase domain-containing protein [Acidimicrobiales bacterium]
MPESSLATLPDIGSPFIAGTRFDLVSVGYEGSEYVFRGSADAYGPGPGGLRVVGRADFATRLLVYRPVDDAAFNGTVWVEWLNVSGGLDASPDWLFTHTELMRRGAAWVGVSAQKIGVEGGGSLIGLASYGLMEVDPARYGALHHPGDRFSYDIYAQAGAAVGRASGTILDGLAVERVLAIGESQSAFRLTTYVNEIDPVTPVYDGFLVHARGRAAAPLDDEKEPAEALRGGPVLFGDDLRVPVLCVSSETDLMTLGYLDARQDDGDALVTWEIAGTAHGDMYTFVVGPMDSGTVPVEDLAAAWRPVSEVYGMGLDKLVNAGPQHYVMNAAVSQLDGWVASGTRPAASPRLAMRDGTFVTDDHGNVKGGIRTPHVDVPTAVLSGMGNSGHPVAYLCGTTTPFDAPKLYALYRSKDDYIDRFTAATDSAREGGFILADDAAEIIGIATLNAPF